MARNLLPAGLMYPHTSRFVAARHILAETRALAARFSTPPTAVRLGHINRLIRDLKLAGLYTNTKIKGLYLFAAADAQAARQNWIENASNLSVTGSMTFTADRGYASDGATGELTGSGAPPSFSSVHQGVWLNNGSDAAIEVHGTNGFIFVQPTQISGRAGSTITSIETGLSGAKHGVLTSSTDTLKFYRNGAEVLSEANSPGGSSGTIRVANTTIGGWPTGRHAVAHWGALLTGSEIAALYAALNTYLTALGAN